MGAETINGSKQIREISAPSDEFELLWKKKHYQSIHLYAGGGDLMTPDTMLYLMRGLYFLNTFQGESSIRNQLSAYCHYTNGFTGKENKQYHTVNSESQTMNER